MLKPIVLIFTLILLSSYSVHSKELKDPSKNVLTEGRKSTILEFDRKEGQLASNRLTTLAQSVPGVQDVTAVVLGKYTLIGIVVDENIKCDQIETIQYKVIEALKHDPNGAYATVVTDPDLYASIHEIATRVSRGESARGILNNLADIANQATLKNL